MKTYLLLFCLICSMGLGFSQNQAFDFTGNKIDQARDPRNDLMNFVPNEVLIKFKDAVPVASGVRMKAAGVNSVDKVLQAHGITLLEKLFPTEQKPQKARMMKSPQGKVMPVPALDKIYRVSVPPTQISNSLPTNIFQLIEELKALSEVEYAEPNYIYSIDNMQPVGSVLTAEDVLKLQKNNPDKANESFTPNDPLYSQQDYIQTIKADQVWQQTTGDTTQVIAILDTGVDWNHPDLKNKIWTNPNPATSWNVNGILNDIRGWDFINNDNNPMDDNSHGTHVAGIAAAETKNGIGIAGVCPKAKIMPLKVLSNKGTGDVATIVRGINYAASHGATVINLSLGSYARSLTMENALLNAYPNAIIVAASGNDELSIYDILPTGFPATYYPAAFTFVLGVQSDGAYSNYDPDGPVYSEYTDGINYELKAPGAALSTIPNGNYRIFNGTSMATPIVSGSVALYRSLFPNKSLEELWSDFVHSSNGIIDLNTAFYSTSKLPQLDLVNFTIDDQNDGNDKDNKADAGEIINLTLKIRNTGNPANVVYAEIKPSNDGNPDDITILKDTVHFGDIGIYRSMTNEANPFKIKISKNCNNNSNVSLDVLMHNNVDTTVFVQSIKFKIYNGQELTGILLRDTTLTPNKNWVISNSLRISTGVTLTILPGTSIEVLAGVDNRGKVLAIGTPEKRIYMKGVIGGNSTYKYADIDNLGNNLNSNLIEHCNLTNINWLQVNRIKYSKISNIIQGNSGGRIECDTIYRCYINNACIEGAFNGNIYESLVDNFIIGWSNSNIKTAKYNVFDKSINIYAYVYPNGFFSSEHLKYPAFLLVGDTRQNYKNTFLNNGISTYFVKTDGTADIMNLPNEYWGTNNLKKIKSKFYDFTNSSDLPYLNIEPRLIAPSDSCPGHVWKVLVNGKDAQDEIVDPLGIGKHRFDIYFNRAMNKDSIPQVTFGGIYPYTSNKINENGSWSEDGKIYTVYKTIKLTIADGINQIRVTDAKQAENWGWKIPVEDSRFSFIISAANSASAEFMATQGPGKVKLEWNKSDLEDYLGYNMYRMEHINDSTLTSPTLINSTLITDTIYTDFAVSPNKKYYYYYKILRTNLAETDSSKIVSAIPLTSNNREVINNLKIELGQNYPNPVNGKTIFPIYINEPINEAVVRIVNMLGQEVEIIRIANPTIGDHLLSWNPGANKGLFVYTLEIKTGNQKYICPVKKMIVQ